MRIDTRKYFVYKTICLSCLITRLCVSYVWTREEIKELYRVPLYCKGIIVSSSI